MKGQVKGKTGKVDSISRIVVPLFGMFALFILFSLCPIAAYAHAPKQVTLVYKADSQMLEATIVHETPSPNWHYINKVEIKKNGKSVNVNEYKNQPDKSIFVYTYKVQAAKDDVLEVTASCNIYGSKTVKMTVGSQAR